MSGLGWPSLIAGDGFLLFDAIELSGNVWLLEPTE